MDRENNRKPNRRKMGNNKPSKPTRIDQMNRPLDRLTAGQLERLKRMQDRLEEKTTISSYRSRHVNRWPS